MKIIGHRGALGLAKENTLSSIKKAMECGVDELEFDLRVTRDGVVILNHHRYIVGNDKKPRIIAKNTFAELAAQTPDLTTFEAVLDHVKQSIHLYIEVKPGEQTEPIIRTIRAQVTKGWKTSSFSFGSYSQQVLRELHAAFPEVETIVIENWSSYRARRRARELGTKRLSMSRRWLWGGFISMMAKGGWQISAFTINDPKKAARWSSAGLYGVVTDYPDRFQK